ncbi:sulfotransferase family protein [Cerasicoccus frondis]|uniref:sulfotransferase family protein n=1 Tax=Cerasicoccus frondis TaxID=490090 RepID=UPI0028529797|nr:sulfotransferase [Cerasicoccus frondis]
MGETRGHNSNKISSPAPRAGAPLPPSQTIYVLGAFRSGTTLLHSLLNAHPDIALIYELNLHERFPLMPSPIPRNDWRQRWDFWNGSLSRMGLPTDRDPTPPVTWDDAAKRLFAEYAASQGARYGGEKSPVYAHSAQALLAAEPEAKFIILWRDPADILRSMRRAALKSRYFKKPLIDAWFLVGLEKLLAAFEQPPANVCQLSYHELTLSPEETLQRIWRFLQVDESCVDAAQFAPAFAIGSEADLHRPLASGKIHSPPTREEILNLSERQKIARYRQAWAQRFSLEGKFLESPADMPNSELTAQEAALDRFAARTFQAYNRAIQSLYLRAPLPLLQKYRTQRSK